MVRVTPVAGADVVGRLTRSLPRSSRFGLPVCVAGVPAAPLCETPTAASAAADALKSLGSLDPASPTPIAVAGIVDPGPLFLANALEPASPMPATEDQPNALFAR